MAIAWKKAREKYERGAGFVEVAESVGCRADTVRRRARKEGWVSPEDEAREREALTTLFRGVSRRITGLVADALEEKDPARALEKLKVAKIAAETQCTLVKTEKENEGKNRNEPQDHGRETGEIAREMVEATLPPGAGEAHAGGGQVRGGTRREEERKDGARQEKARDGALPA